MKAVVREPLRWLGLILLVLAEHAVQGDRGVPWPWLLAGIGALAVAGALARMAPLVSWLLVGVVALSQVSGQSISPPFLLSYTVALAVVGYHVGRTVESTRLPLLGFAGTVPAGLLVAVVAGGGSLPLTAHHLTSWIYLLGALLVLGVLPWLAGRYRRLRAGLTRAGWERERLRERARIAHDMHDSLGHALSVAALRAGVVEVDPEVDERCREFAGDMRLAMTDAARELRTAVGVLRHDQDDPAPAHETVADLVDRTARSGLAVRLEHVGEPVRLDPLADRAVYRVVQESLTNAAKHARGADVLVELAYRAGDTVVTVTNGPPPDGPPATAVRGRRGLVGLAERVRVAGGELTAEPHGGGFRVVARLPHGERPAPVPVPDLERERRPVGGVALPVGICAAVTALVLGGCTGWVLGTVLAAPDFDRLRLGTPRERVAESLPPFELGTGGPPPPPGASCSDYLTSAAIVPAPESLYRLCFAEGRLVSKDLVPN